MVMKKPTLGPSSIALGSGTPERTALVDTLKGAKRGRIKGVLKGKEKTKFPSVPKPISGRAGIPSANADLDIAAPLPPEVKKR